MNHSRDADVRPSVPSVWMSLGLTPEQRCLVWQNKQTNKTSALLFFLEIMSVSFQGSRWLVVIIQPVSGCGPVGRSDGGIQLVKDFLGTIKLITQFQTDQMI